MKNLSSKIKIRFMRYLTILKGNFTAAINFIFKLAKLLAKAISSCIVLFILAQLVPELPEKMPALFKLIDIILEGFDTWLMNTSFMSRWF